MKKIMLSLAMALVSVCASAQVYIGGTAGISSNKIGDGDSKTAYTLMPEIGYEFNNKWEAGLEIGIKKGDVCELSAVPEATTFIVAPYGTLHSRRNQVGKPLRRGYNRLRQRQQGWWRRL